MHSISPLTVVEVAQFFDRLAVWKQDDARRFMEQFADLIPRFQEVQITAEIANRQFAPHFNIFNLLGFQRSEKFHSDFLAFLLSPHANHAQGHLFLEAFFDVLRQKYPGLVLPDTPINRGVWMVQRELITRDGNLDLVLNNPSMGWLYIIENKVDAGEQPYQLARYGAYLARRKKDYPYQGLLYLTPGGSAASTAANTPYWTISYHHEIHAWLETTLARTQSATVRETTRQYLALIKSL